MNQEANLKPRLQEGLKQFKLGTICDPLWQYLLLLNKWNLAYNLTAIRDLPSMIDKHILDSLAILPWLKGHRILDVGSGAGLPGIPLAVARPEIQFVLLDSNGKKIRFLQEVQRQLNLKNLEIVQFRAENYHPTQGFDTVLSRAFSNLEQMIHWTKHLINKEGLWLAMKGRYPDTELKLVQQSYRIETYNVVGIEGERCCVLIENNNKE